MYYKREHVDGSEVYVEVEPIRRWYCFVEDALDRCRGYFGPGLYDPDEPDLMDEGHFNCGWIEILSGTVQAELDL